MKFYNTKVIDYGNGNKQVITYKKPVPILEKEEGEKKRVKSELKYYSQILDVPFPTEEELAKKELHSFYSSANRTKREVYKLARANTWQWFVTFTFDKNKVKDRTDYVSLVNVVRKYFNHWKERKCPNMKYLFVPEQHKKIEENGKRAWHFHGLLANADGLTFIKLTDEEKAYYDISTSDDVYRIKEYKLGLCTATKVKGSDRVSHYITKYITKAISGMLKGKRRYIYSKNCNKPAEYRYMCMDYLDRTNLDNWVKPLMDDVHLADVMDITKVVYKNKKVIETEDFENEYTYYELQGDYTPVISKDKLV